MPCRFGWSIRKKLRRTLDTTECGNQPQVIASAGAAEALRARLQSLVRDLVAGRTTSDQAIAYSVVVTGEFPERLHAPLFRIAAELVDHALRHGMALLQQGRIEIALMTEEDGSIELAIRDNGWQPLCHAGTGEEGQTVRILAGAYGGTFAVRRKNEWTEAVVRFPSQPASDHSVLTVLVYGVGLLGIVWGAIALEDIADHGARSMQAVSVCIASVILIRGSECPANHAPPPAMRSAEGPW